MLRNYCPLLKIITKQIIRATIKHGMWLKVAMTRCILLTIIIWRYDGVNGKKTCCLIKLLSGRSMTIRFIQLYKEFGYWIRKYGKMNYVAFERKRFLTIVKMKKSGRFLNLRILFISSLLMLFTSTTAVD
jgi:hypothetical protein